MYSRLFLIFSPKVWTYSSFRGKYLKILTSTLNLMFKSDTLGVCFVGMVGLGGIQSFNLGSGNVIVHSLSCTMPNCTVLINQEVVATFYQLAYLTFSIVCLRQQSRWVKPPNDSPGRPLVLIAASGAGSGLGGKMIGKKKWCRSAQTRHLFKKPVRSKSGARSPFPWLLLVALSRELI